MSSRTLGAVLVGAILVVGTAFASRIPVDAVSDGARVRLSWRADGLTLEECRERTAEELEALPAHMRSPQACIGELAPFALSVSIDDEVVVEDTIRPGGARGDRPVYVFREVAVAPGEYEAIVDFRAIAPEGFEVPPAAVYRWGGSVSLAPGDIVLVTIDDRGDMIVRTGR